MKTKCLFNIKITKYNLYKHITLLKPATKATEKTLRPYLLLFWAWKSKIFPSVSFPDEFCDGYPHNVLPTPGYWIECSRAISNQGSAWTNDDRDLHEIDEGITDSPDGSLRDTSVITEFEDKDPAMPK